MSAMLEVKNLCKRFPTHAGMLHAVEDVTFSIEKGKTLGVVGESGCGKTTLGRMIVRLLNATSGQVLYGGEDILQAPDERMMGLRRKMQIIFQDPFSSLDPRMTVSQIIQEPLNIYRMCESRADCRKRVLQLMDTVGLAARYENTYPHELDGGRRQRIVIARALALDPEFIVCDEPVSSLDVSIQAQILNLLQDLQQEKGLTYIFITHNLSVVKHISDDILVMYMGNMVEKCHSKELFRNAMHPYTKALLSAIPIPKIGAKKYYQPMKGEITSPVNPKPGCRFAPRCQFCTEACRTINADWIERTPGHFIACHALDNTN